MSDWNQLRDLGQQVSPPPFDSLVTTARERDRRRRVVTGAVALTLLGAIALGVGITGGPGSMTQPAGDPAQPLSTPTEGKVFPGGVLPLPEQEAGEEAVMVGAGRYRVPLSETLSLDVDLPAGTEVNGEGLYLVRDDTILKVEAAGEEYGVPEDPCLGFADITRAGPTVGDLVQAIRDQPPYRTSRPQSVQIGNAEGSYLKLRIPSGYDASTCVEQQVGLPGNPGTNNNMEPGYLGQWWILAAGGQRAVVQTFCELCDADVSTPLTRAVQSITFTATP